MSHPEYILVVKFKSPLPYDEVVSLIHNRADAFRSTDGLIQKYYSRDPVSGDYVGVYLWERDNALEAFRKSNLRETIAKVYQVEGEPRMETFEIFYTLRDSLP